MDNVFVMIIALMFIFLLSILLFVYFTSTGVKKDVHSLKSELEKAQAPMYSPMGVVSSLMKFFLSLFS